MLFGHFSAAPASLPRRKQFNILLTALAITGAGGVFAVASLAPDAADLPVQQVLEDIALPSPSAILGAAAEATADTATLLGSLATAPELTLFRTDTTRSSDTADALLRRLGLQDAAAAAFLRNDPLVRKHLMGKAGRSVSAEATQQHGLKKLNARWMAAPDDRRFNRLVVEQGAGGAWQSTLETAPLVASTRLASGTIQSSLFAATDAAGLPDAIATQIAEVFSGDIDFHRALRKGDRFAVTYETLQADGETLRTGKVLSAEFVNNGKKYSAMWFADPARPGAAGAGASISALGGVSLGGAYYTLEGNSLRRAFLASPLEFSRVTSGFKMRLHPISKTWKQHLGVDYAAPTGTPVRSIGDGVVEFAGVQRGFGNVVIVDHGKGNTTVYAHLSKIHVLKGEKISQTKYVGEVGTTGWSTGPHLHFEFRVHGEHQDPLTMAHLAETQPVSSAAKLQFAQVSAQVKVALAAAASLKIASAE